MPWRFLAVSPPQSRSLVPRRPDRWRGGWVFRAQGARRWVRSGSNPNAPDPPSPPARGFPSFGPVVYQTGGVIYSRDPWVTPGTAGLDDPQVPGRFVGPCEEPRASGAHLPGAQRCPGVSKRYCLFASDFSLFTPPNSLLLEAEFPPQKNLFCWTQK